MRILCIRGGATCCSDSNGPGEGIQGASLWSGLPQRFPLAEEGQGLHHPHLTLLSGSQSQPVQGKASQHLATDCPSSSACLLFIGLASSPFWVSTPLPEASVPGGGGPPVRLAGANSAPPLPPDSCFRAAHRDCETGPWATVSSLGSGAAIFPMSPAAQPGSHRPTVISCYSSQTWVGRSSTGPGSPKASGASRAAVAHVASPGATGKLYQLRETWHIGGLNQWR